MSRVRFVLFAVFAMALVVGLSGTALAYDETTTTIPPQNAENCGGCHNPYFSIGTGVHGGYTTMTTKCKQCHTVHAAPADSILLLPGPTVSSSCFSCHDGTGGRGVYGAITAQGLTVEASHSVDATSHVPGGDYATGGGATQVFGGPGGTLGCTDCHSPHASQVVKAFVGDRVRTSAQPLPLPTSKLLKTSPGETTTVVTRYGSDWCLNCHAGRTSGGPVHNHPVESSSTVAVPFDYSNVALVAASGVDTGTTILGQMGGVNTPADASIAGGNRGYLMPYPRTAEQSGHLPICMQCHEDSRSVGSLVGDGSLANVTAAVITNPDGATAGDNPRFQNFPHETVNARMRVEPADDLCLNCHPTGGLP